jgi:hypothetical protein
MSKPDFAAAQRALYRGRRKLGRFVQTSERRFKAFGSDDCSLGLSRSSKHALAAIMDPQTGFSHSSPEIDRDGDIP